MADIQPKVTKQVATATLGEQEVASQIASQILLIEQTNYLFYTIKNRLEMNEIWPKAAKKLAIQVVASQMASQIVLIEQTDFLFYPIKFQIEIAEIQSKVTKNVSHGNYVRLSVGQLDGQLDCTK